MNFIDSYKRLEKLCSEIYDDNHGLSCYIDEMKNTPAGSRYVSGWDEDLKQLKHYRWVRNQIVHEPDRTEENMCEPGDAEWLSNFYSRIMSASDPLACYRKARGLQAIQKPKQTFSTASGNNIYPENKKASPKSAGCLIYVIGVLLVAVTVAFILAII